MLPTINFIEVPSTSFCAKDSPYATHATGLLAPMTAPIFVAEPGAEQRVFTDVVAVVYRNAAGKPVHGGLFGFGTQGVAQITLKDLAGQVDTSEDPAHVAFGLIMMRGPLVFRQNGLDQKMEVSILDLFADKLNEPLPAASLARDAVRAAYLGQVLPAADIPQP